MKATVVYVSESGTSALVSVEEPIKGTPFSNKVMGWMPVNGEVEKGQEFDLPFTIIHQSQSVTDDGQTFTWLSFS